MIHTVILLHNVQLLLYFERLLKCIVSVILIARTHVKLPLYHVNPVLVGTDVITAHIAV